MVSVREWSDEFNPFNSWKVLMSKDYLEAIVSGEFKPPLTCDTDLTNVCNLNCVWCNSYNYRKANEMALPNDHVLRLADFYAEWGIKSTCIAGGGESMLHPLAAEFIRRVHSNGLEVGVITNGTYLPEELVDVLARIPRYVGISFDAGNADVYSSLKGVPPHIFDKVIENMTKLCLAHKGFRSLVPRDITVKFLIHPGNAHTIFAATKIVKQAGCDAIHIRPVGLSNLRNPNYQGQNFHYSFDELQDVIDEQLAMAVTLESSDFKVYAPRKQKFGDRLQKVVRFNKCHATPLHIVFGADQWTHICFNLRGYPDARLVKHFPDPNAIKEFWGSDAHKKMIDMIDPINGCPRCTFSHYQLVIERMIMKDSCYWKFV